ncbi:YitT family protein [Clostridiaceae bacterium M8S5]|nr:YitT family protein [Clostridiaceae bacterium M8S5]
MVQKLKDYIFINLGLLIMAIGLYFFLIPANLAVGGVSGLAMVIQGYLPSINIGLVMGVFNIILFLLGLIVIGKQFGGKTIYCSFLLSIIIGVFEIVLPLEAPISDDIIINLVFGIIIQGIGMAIIFHYNASTGGTDIIAKIINKYTHIDIGKSLFLSDSLITLLAGLTFGLTLGLYAFLGILINGLIIDKVIEKINVKIHALVISQDFDTVNNFIHNELKRGTTFLPGVGGYTNSDKKIISVVLTYKEYKKLKIFIKKQTPKTFIIMNFVNEVLGEGFDLTLQVR